MESNARVAVARALSPAPAPARSPDSGDEITEVRRSLAEPAVAAKPTDAAAVPSALLCTDLEGFTATVLHLGDVAARALIRDHNRLLRACLERCGGLEATHTGDGILASFSAVQQAIECATAMQVELRAYNRTHAAMPLRIRIGLHVGAPLPEEGRLFGSCVNVTVRVCRAAEGERIYVSEAFRQRADGHPCRLLDRGAFVLKGIDDAVRLHELVWE